MPWKLPVTVDGMCTFLGGLADDFRVASLSATPGARLNDKRHRRKLALMVDGQAGVRCLKLGDGCSRGICWPLVEVAT